MYRSFFMNSSLLFFIRISLTSTLFLLVQFAEAQSPSQNLFIEIDVSADRDKMVRYGRIAYNKDNTPKRRFFKGKNARHDFLDTLNSSLSSLPEQKRNTLFYIHGMWAYKWSFLKGNHKKMQNTMWDNAVNPNGMVVTIIWHCKVNYFDNVEMALKSGKILSPIIRDIHDVTAAASPSSQTNYMVHSMGHRVFQSIWDGYFKEDMKYKAGHIVMAGADLETNSFESGEVLADIGYLTNDVLLYVHNNDRTLGISKILNEKDRLGMQGIADLNKITSSIWQIDVSIVNDNEDAAAQFSNHRYFYMSPTIRKDIALFFQGVEKSKLPRRKKLDHERRFMLELPQDN